MLVSTPKPPRPGAETEKAKHTPGFGGVSEESGVWRGRGCDRQVGVITVVITSRAGYYNYTHLCFDISCAEKKCLLNAVFNCYK